MQIRPLTLADLEAYKVNRLEALANNPEAFGSDLAESQRLTPEEWANRIAPGPDRLMLGAFLGGQIVGTAGLLRERGAKVRHKATVFGVYVSPSSRRQGVARLLMESLLAHARSLAGLEQIHLAVVSDNVAARTLYERLGFVTYGREPRALQLEGRYLDEDHMILRLNENGPI